MTRLTMTLRRPTRDRLRAFWVAIDGLGGAVVEGGVLRLGSHWAAAACLIGIVLAGLSGWLDPDLVAPLYDGWRALARHARHVLQAWLLFLAFRMVWMAGRTGAATADSMTGPTASGWTRRGTIDEHAYATPAAFALPGHERGWTRDLVGWVWRGGRPWVLALVPLLAILRALGASGRSVPGGRNYTLY